MFKNVEIEWVTKTEVADIFKCEKDIKTIKLSHTSIPLLFDIKKLGIIIRSFFNPYDAIFNLEVSKKYDYLVNSLSLQSLNDITIFLIIELNIVPYIK